MEKTVAFSNQPQSKFGWIYRFFCWCSGARLYILKKCPTDYNIFMGVGVVVFLSGVMAAISGSYAFFTVFNNFYLAAGFGFFWGLLIFFLDWYLVASLRKENNFKKELLMASPRFVLAVFLAVVIARPLEMKLFEKEINAQLTNLSGEKRLEFKGLIDNEYVEIEKLKDENNSYLAEIKKLEDSKTFLFDLFIAEAEGKSPVGVVGKGPVYREKKAEYDAVCASLERKQEMYFPLIDANNQRIKELNSLKDQLQLKSKNTFDNADGFLARMEAFSALTSKNNGISYASWFIILLFICIEIAPIIVKLMSDRGPYDECLDLERFNISSQARREITTSRNNLNRSIAIENEKYLMKLDAEMRNNKEFISTVMEAQLELGKQKIQLWKEHEMKKIESNIENYQPTIDELINDARTNLKIN